MKKDIIIIIKTAPQNKILNHLSVGNEGIIQRGKIMHRGGLK